MDKLKDGVQTNQELTYHRKEAATAALTIVMLVAAAIVISLLR